MAGHIAIVACSVMKLELQAVIGARPVDLFFLEQGLHNTPQLMPSRTMELELKNYSHICYIVLWHLMMENAPLK